MQQVFNFNVPIIPAAFALDAANKRIAFEKKQKSTSFVDSLNDNPTAFWGDKQLTLKGKEYKYNVCILFL